MRHQIHSRPLGGPSKERAIERLRKIDEGIWTLEGDPVSFFTFPYEIRSTIVDLGGKGLFVHSPVQLAVAAEAVASLGRVGFIVTPNKMHHLFLAEWQAAFPDARIYSPPGLRPKRPDLCFHGDLGDQPEAVWASVLDQRVVRGSFFMEEAVFFHIPSRTLIVGDLIENHDPGKLTAVQRAFARANDMLAPHGTTARILRLSFWQRAEARRVIEKILSWRPRRVVVMHGPCIEDDAAPFLRHAFDWLL